MSKVAGSNPNFIAVKRMVSRSQAALTKEGYMVTLGNQDSNQMHFPYLEI